MPLIVAVLLAGTGLWAWSTFGPQPPTLAELRPRYLAIEDGATKKWTAANNALAAAGSDYGKLHAGFQSMYDATKEYVDGLQQQGDWGPANGQVSALVQAGQKLETTLTAILAEPTATGMQTLAANDYQTDYTTFTQSISIARVALGLPAAVGATPAPSGSARPGASNSPGTSASAAPSASVPSASAGSSGSGAGGSPAPSGSGSSAAPPATAAPSAASS